MVMFICLSVALLTGCVIPGSNTGHVSIRGSLALATGEPLPHREIQFLLPAAYGLGGLDLVLLEPEDFGQQDHSFRVTTNSKGKFDYHLGDRVYHVDFWLLPPLGAVPRYPPAPFLLVRVPSFPGEYYAVQTYNGQFKTFAEGGAELPLSQSHLSELSASSESGRRGDGMHWTVGVIDLRFAAQ